MMLQRIGQKGGLRGTTMRYRERLIRTRMVLGAYSHGINQGYWFLTNCLDRSACVGRNLASLELLIIISSIFRRYEIVLEHPEEPVSKYFV